MQLLELKNKVKIREVFVTGIDTNVGKTIVSSILVKALGGDYWKPIQCGDLHQSDTMKVKELVNCPQVKYFPETYRLKEPLSPNQAAARENRFVQCHHFTKIIPRSGRPLIIEGAGGVMVPFNDQETLLDLMKIFNVPIVVVTKNYLGSLNHTLLTVETLKTHGLDILGLIFSGATHEESEEFLLRKTNLPCLGRVREEKYFSPEIIQRYAHEWVEHWKENKGIRIGTNI